MSAQLARRAVVSVFLRSFLIQGSWNYRTMLGSGFAFSLLPGLRSIFGGDRDRVEAALQRHVEHFNAHPYLAGLALGAVLRLEAEGEDPEAIRRFKLAVRGPLGGIGDALVWATLLPGVAVLTLVAYALGAPGWACVAGFLLVYNAVHLGLRAWGLSVGLARGRDVAAPLARADLGGWAARMQGGVALALGVLVGLLLSGPQGVAGAGAVWIVPAVAAFLAGLLVGHQVWRPAAATVVVVIGLLAAVGLFK